MNFNRVILAGNLTRDPESRTFGDQLKAKVGLAINRKYKDRSGETKEEVVFIDLECWGKTAETLVKYGTKGTGLHVEGKLKLEQWDDKDGKKRSRHLVVIDSFQFTGPAKTSQGGDGPNVRDEPAAPPAPAPAGPVTTTSLAAAGGDDEPPF